MEVVSRGKVQLERQNRLNRHLWLAAVAALDVAFTGCWAVQCSNCLDVDLDDYLENCMFAFEWLDYTFEICRPWLEQ